MRRSVLTAAGLAAFAAMPCAGAAAQQMPTAVGTCSATTITEIGTRFGPRLVQPKNGDADDGTSIALKNGVYGISYRYVPEVGRSRIGDKVLTCLVSVPTGCPKGDDRGKVYTTTNLRTQESWTLSDSQHMCGGA